MVAAKRAVNAPTTAMVDHGRVVADEQRPAAGDHVDAGRHHRGGVDQGRHGRRAFHRVGQPDVERELGRLAERAEHQQERDPAAGPCCWNVGQGAVVGRRPVRAGRCGCRPLAEVADGAEGQEAEHDAQAEPEVADAVDEERLLGRLAGGGLVVVVADQQVGAEADAFPPEVEHDEVIAHDQAGHHEDEQPEVGEEAEVPLLALHVPGGEDGDEEADAADDAEHDRRQRVEPEPGRDVEGLGRGVCVGGAGVRPGDVHRPDGVGRLAGSRGRFVAGFRRRGHRPLGDELRPGRERTGSQDMDQVLLIGRGEAAGAAVDDGLTTGDGRIDVRRA